MQVEKRWLIKNGVEWIGIDSASGGYPYNTNFWNAEKFRSLEDALKYKGVSFTGTKDWQIYECDEIGTRFVTSNATSLYELELVKLKKLHNIT